MTRCIVTGATGFIGRRLVHQLLCDGHSVKAMLQTGDSGNGLDSRVASFRADVTRRETLDGQFADCDVVFHLAGCTIARSKNEFDLVNHRGTLNVARACAKEDRPPLFLFVSSLAAAGPSQPAKPHVESDLPQPVSDYGRSKRDAEMGLLEMADRISIRIARPPSVFGDTDPYLLSLFKAAKFGLVLKAGPGTPSYSYIHVDDLVRALIHIAECPSVQVCDSDRGNAAADGSSRLRPELVYVAHRPPLTFPQVAALVAEAVGTNVVRQIRIPTSLCWTLAFMNSLGARLFRLRPLLNLDKMREGMAGSWTCDPKRLTEDWGFEFPTPLETQIRETAKSYQAMGKI